MVTTYGIDQREQAMRLAEAAKAAEQYQTATGETRPNPNDEQHRSFQLAVKHRELNDRYAERLQVFARAIEAFADVLDYRPVNQTTKG